MSLLKKCDPGHIFYSDDMHCRHLIKEEMMMPMTHQPISKKQYFSVETKKKLSIALLVPIGIMCCVLLFILGNGM